MLKSLVAKAAEALDIYPLFGRLTADTATVFMMHAVAPDRPAGNIYDITTPLLRDYLTYLRNGGYRVMSLTDYVNALQRRESTKKTVVFTVDDGFRDFYLHAYPVFREFGYPATIFLTSDFIEGKLFFWWNHLEHILRNTRRREADLSGRGLGVLKLDGPDDRGRALARVVPYCKLIPNAEKLAFIAELGRMLEVDAAGQPSGPWEPLKWDEILEMQRNRIEFYPHTKTHPILTRISRQEKLTELGEPKRLFEERLKAPMDIFCYPNGGRADFDEETIACLKETGYRAAVTGISGYDDTRADNDMFRLRRFALPGHPFYFKQYICGLERFKEKYLGMAGGKESAYP